MRDFVENLAGVLDVTEFRVRRDETGGEEAICGGEKTGAQEEGVELSYGVGLDAGCK